MAANRLALAFVLALGLSAAVPAQEMRIQFAEAVDIAATPGTTEFDAFGRRFNLEFESNDRLLKALPSARKLQLQRVQPVRGKIAGVDGSWVRLARIGGSLEGAIWDGKELYVVSSAARIAPYLVNPLHAAPDKTVVYRLSDTLNAFPAQFCGLQGSASALPASSVGALTALKQYQSMVDELRLNAAVVPTDQLDLSLIADSEFQNLTGANAAEEMVSRLNVVDGIFAAQVGVLLVPTELRLLPSGNSLTSTNASTLLGQLATFRSSTPAVNAPGLAHLISGKDLDGTTIGIAYLDSLCDPTEGVSLSTSGDVTFLNAVVMAHEIGHNFGAQHDGEMGSVCESTPPNFVMSPTVNGSISFSACSKTTMAPRIAQARGVCIGQPNYADIELIVPAPVTADVNAVFAVPFTVRSIGNRAATSVTLDLMVPANLAFQSATVANGSCAVVGANVHCTLGNILAAESRLVEVRYIGTRVTQYNLVAHADAENDYLVDDNERQFQLNLRSAFDIAVAASVSPGTVFINDPFTVTVDVSSTRSQTVRGGSVQVNLFGMAVDSIAAGPHTCTTFDSVVTCQIADLASGATSRLTVTGHSTIARGQSIQVIGLLADDADQGNNLVNLNLNVRAEREILIVPSATEINAVVGQSFNISYTLTVAGRFAVEQAQFRVQDIPFDYFTIESIVPGVGTCDAPNDSFMYCNFGTLSPGDVRTVVVRVHADRIGSASIAGTSLFTYNGVLGYSGATTDLRSSVALDVVASGSAPPAITEGEISGGTFTVQSLGAQHGQNVVATLEVPAPLRLTSVSTTGVAGLTCALLNAQQARCTGAFASTSPISINYLYAGDTPGDYHTAFHITADGDVNGTNDDVEYTIRVLTYLDVRIATTVTRLDFVVGQLTTLNTTVTAGTRAVPGVRAIASSSLPFYEVESMSAPGYTCQAEPFGASCNLGDLPAGVSVPVSVRYRPLRDNVQSQVTVGVQATRDSNGSNNAVNVSFDIMSITDVGLQVASSTASATNGVRFQYPAISVTSASTLARNVVVNVTLPTFVTVDSVSSSAICSGTATLRCDFGVIGAGATGTLNIALMGTAVGTFTSDVTLVASNDSTAGNNSSSVAMSVTAASSGSSSSGGGASSSSGGGGGGGRIEWLMLVLLGGAAIRRATKGRLAA